MIHLADDGGILNGGDDTSPTQSFTVTVTAVNDAPTAVDDNLGILEDAAATTVDVLANDTIVPDAGETLSITAITQGASGAVAIISGGTRVRYTPSLNANGSDSFTYTISDGNGGTDTATVNVTITAVNDAPSFTKGADQTDLEDAGTQSVPGWATALSRGPADESAQTLTFSVTGNTNAALFSVLPTVSSTGTLAYTPAANANGTATITIQLADNGGVLNGGVNTSPTQTFTITVNAVNDAPSFTKGANQAALEDSGAHTVAGWATALLPGGGADEVGQVLSFVIDTNTNTALFAAGPAVSSTGTLTYTLAANANGTATIMIHLADDGGILNGGDDTSPTQSFTVTVTAVNDAPSFTKGADQVVLEDAGAQSIPLWATSSTGPADESVQVPAFVIDTNTNAALFSAAPTVSSTGTLAYTPAANANGTATITLHVTDDGGTANGGVNTSPTRTFTITITSVNDAPSFTKGADQVVLEDAGAKSVAGWATALSRGPADESAQTLTFSVTGNTNPGLFSAAPTVSSTGTLAYTAATDANGSATITIQLADSGGTANGGVDSSPTQTFTITVTAVNDAPSFLKGANQAVLEDAGAQSIPLWATWSTGPADEVGQVPTFVIDTNTNAALFSVLPTVSSTGTLAYTPAANANGTATITLHVTDNGGTANGGVNTSPTQTFTITVTPVNDAPSFTKGANQTDLEDAGTQSAPGWATAIFEGASNESSQSVTFSVTDNSNPGLFSVLPAIAADGTLTYTAAADANGIATIDVVSVDDGGTANGGDDTSASQTFMITITAVNDAPSFTRGADQTVLEDAGAQTAPGWGTDLGVGPADESAQALAFEITSDSNAGLFAVAPSISADGTLAYTPAADANGSAVVGLRVTDDGGTANGGVDASASVDVTITVTPVNDAPTFTGGGDVGAPEDAGPQTVAAWATDVSAGPGESAQAVTFTITANDNPTLFKALGQPSISSSGALTFTPERNHNGTATLDVVLSDDGGTAYGGVDTSATVQFRITIAGANDPPIAANDLVSVHLAGPIVLNVLANDSGGPDEQGDPISITSVSPGSRGYVTIAGDGSGVTYDPIGCTTGTDTFNYTVTDSFGLTDTATVLVTLTAPAAVPQADGPRPTFVTNSTIGTTVPMRLSWCGVTSGTTIRSYRLARKVNGGTATTVTSVTSATSTTQNLSVSPTGYQYLARVTDNKSRTSAYAAGPVFRVVRTQDSSPSIVYSTGWLKATSSSYYSGSTARYTSSKGKSATFIYTGSGFAIVGPRSSTRGSFYVYVDDVKVATVSERATTSVYRRVLYVRSLAQGTHTIRIVTAGNGRIDLDAILSLS
jgi:large repetitive protein